MRATLDDTVNQLCIIRNLEILSLPLFPWLPPAPKTENKSLINFFSKDLNKNNNQKRNVVDDSNYFESNKRISCTKNYAI